jgi:hypothetical protein
MKDYSMYKYYKGEAENPFEEGDNDASLLWFYEYIWHHENEKNSEFLNMYVDEYRRCYLENFEQNDGIPISLKALLFNRFAKQYDAMIFAVEDFKKWYIQYYRNN